MKNDKLAIAIPTYNRARILKENLSYMMDEIKKYNIPIYISDDSDNNDTLMVVNELKTIYEYIYYYKNKPSLGHDKNCFFTLNLPSEDHIWYLGDSVIIEKGTIFLVLELLKKAKYDFVVTNHKGRNLNIASKLFIDAKDVFSDLAWHLTLSGVTIYRKKIIENYKVKGIYKNFPQTSIILNSISENCNLYYIHDAISFVNKNKVSYWNKNTFETFAKDWFIFIDSLPSFYTKIEKKQVIKSHSLHTEIFGIRSLVKYNLLGYLNIKEYMKYHKYINAASHLNKSLIILITILPTKLIEFVLKYKA